MAFNIWDIEPEAMNSGLKGKTILIYGGNNLGKTYQATKLDKPFLMSFEPGGAAVNCAKKNIRKWSEAKQIWNQLCSEKLMDDGEGNRVPEYELMQAKKFQTIIIDTIEAMSDLAQKAIASEEGVSDISEIIGKKNGYSMYRGAIKTEINRLVSYGYTVVFISHAETVKKVDSQGKEVDFIQPRGWSNVKSELRFVCDLCDFCFFVESNGVDEKGNTKKSTAYTKETKRFFARSRFSEIPFRIEEFTAAAIKETIKKAVEDTARLEKAELEEGFVREVSTRSAEDWFEDIKPLYKALIKHDKDKTAKIVAEIIGEGNKISSCDDVVKLELLYNKLDTLQKDLGI